MTNNRISDFYDDEIVDYRPPDVLLSRSDYDELLSLAKDVRRLCAENAELRESVRRLDLSVRAVEVDQQAARRELALVFGEKLKRLRERAQQ